MKFFFGKTLKEEIEKEPANPVDAMQQALDTYGDFHTNADGTLVVEDTIVLRQVIVRQAARSFKELRDQLNEERMAAFKSQNQQAYMSAFSKMNQEQQKAHNDMTRRALEWIGFDMPNFGLSYQNLMKNKADQQRMKEVEEESNHSVFNPEIKQTKEEIIKICKMKLKMDVEMGKKIE